LSPGGDRTYITAGNTERGAAINPANGNVLLVGRAGRPEVYVLNPADGSDTDAAGNLQVLSQIAADGSTQLIAGGTFALNLVDVADDGVVFACNLSTDARANPFKIYRWADDRSVTAPTLAFEGDPLGGAEGSANDLRFGDTFAVRGKGADTQLLVSSRSGKHLVVFSTADGTNFSAKKYATDASGQIGLGVAFGTGSTVWAKAGNAPLRRFQLDAAKESAGTVGTFDPQVATTGPVAVDVATQRLALIDYGGHKVHLFDISDLANPIKQGELAFAAANANGNGTGAADFAGDRLVALDSNNGLLYAKIVKPVLPDPVVIRTQPANASGYVGATVTFAVVAGGTPPLSYQWQFGGGPLAGATNANLELKSIREADGGEYTVVISNAANTEISVPATLNVQVPFNTGILTPLWSIAPGSRAYINTDNTQRGLAFNPVSGNLLVVSRTGGNKVAVLDGQTGAEKHFLRLTDADGVSVVSGGTLPVNMIEVADDGVVYLGNLVTDGAAAAFKLYRWENDAADTVPTVVAVYGLEVTQRWGDTLDLRGGGNDTQILLGSRNGNVFAVLTTTDHGASFSGAIFEVPDVPNGGFGLGIAFGADDTVWGTANGQPLHHVRFDLASGTGSLAAVYGAEVLPGALTAIGVHAAENLLAGIALENPDNIQLYRLPDGAGVPVLADQELILPDRANLNGTGSVDFGGGRLFTLNSNNGVQAFTVDLRRPPGPASLGEANYRSGVFSFVLRGDSGARYKVQYTPDFGSWTDLGVFDLPVSGSTTVSHETPAGAGPSFFYRAVGQ
jgi:hypothetical protein